MPECLQRPSNVKNCQHRVSHLRVGFSVCATQAHSDGGNESIESGVFARLIFYALSRRHFFGGRAPGLGPERMVGDLRFGDIGLSDCAQAQLPLARLCAADDVRQLWKHGLPLLYSRLEKALCLLRWCCSSPGALSIPPLEDGCCIGAYAASVPQSTRAALILFSTLPPAALNFLLAEQFGQKPRRVASIVMLSTLFSFVIIPVALVFCWSDQTCALNRAQSVSYLIFGNASLG